MPSGEQPEFSPHLYNDLKEHLRAKDEDGAIELINQLLSCGRPLGEIIAEIETDPAGEPMPAGHDQGDLAIPAAPDALSIESRQQVEKVDWLEILRRDGAEAVRAGILAAVKFEPGDERQPIGSGSRIARLIGLCLAASVGAAAIAGMFFAPRTFEVETIAGEAQASIADRTPTSADLAEATKAATAGIVPQDEVATTLTLLNFVPEAPSPAALPVPESRSLDATKTAPDSTAAKDQAPDSAAVSDQGRDSAAVLERGSNLPTGFEPASQSAAVLEPALVAVMEPALAAVMEPALAAVMEPALPAEPAANSAVAGGPATDAADRATVSQIVAPTPEAAPQRRAASETEIAAMMARGDALLTTGDITSARLFYRYGADAGDGTAALRLGATFDPAFLGQARLSSVSGDPAKAAHWYRRAHDLGNAEAGILLKSLEPTRK